MGLRTLRKKHKKQWRVISSFSTMVLKNWVEQVLMGLRNVKIRLSDYIMTSKNNCNDYKERGIEMSFAYQMHDIFNATPDIQILAHLDV